MFRFIYVGAIKSRTKLKIKIKEKSLLKEINWLLSMIEINQSFIYTKRKLFDQIQLNPNIKYEGNLLKSKSVKSYELKQKFRQKSSKESEPIRPPSNCSMSK